MNANAPLLTAASVAFLTTAAILALVSVHPLGSASGPVGYPHTDEPVGANGQSPLDAEASPWGEDLQGMPHVMG